MIAQQRNQPGLRGQGVSRSSTPRESGPRSTLSPKTTMVSSAVGAIAASSVSNAARQPWMSPMAKVREGMERPCGESRIVQKGTL